MLSILIADDHSVVRKGLKQILVEEFFSADIGEATNAEDVFTMMMQKDWDLLICDISMPGKNGLEVLQHLRDKYPDIPVLILSIYPEDQYALRVLKAGASGYLNKGSAPEELIIAVRRLLLGKRYITAEVVDNLTVAFNQDAKKQLHEYLSDREFEVMRLLASGNTVSEIADKLLLSVNTISTYRTRVMAKMGVRKNAELTLYAVENKIL